MLVFQNIKSTHITFILSLFGTFCVAQNTVSIPVKVKIIHQDSISIKAETLPEFRNSGYDKDYQGNQISGVIRTILQDSKENFWFGTQSGLCRHNKNGLFYFDIKDLTGNGVTVHSVVEDKIGNIWVGYDRGFAKYDGTYFTTYSEKDILTIGGLWSMTVDKKGLVWIGTTQGVYTFDGKALSPFELPEGKINPNLAISTTKMVHSIIENSLGEMWFATNGGVYIYNGSTLKNISEKDGLPSDFVGQVIESSPGVFWISTSKGICKYDGKILTNITAEFVKNEDNVGCMFEAANGKLWFTMNKREIYCYNGKIFTKIESKVNIFQQLPFSNYEESKVGTFELFPFSIYEDNQNRIWFVGLKGAYRYENKGFINVNRNGPW